MKRILKYWKVAWATIMENRGRSVLTMLGIIIGVGSVVLMTSLGKGAESLILGSVSDLSPKLVYVMPGSPDEGIAGTIIAIDRIKHRDYLALAELDSLEEVTPFLSYDLIFVAEGENENVQAHGTTTGYTKLMNFYPERGRFIEDFDVDGAKKIVVLGKEVESRLFGDQDSLGKTIKIKGHSFKVVGIMEPQGGNAFEDWDNMAFIPLTTMQNYLFGVDFIQSIMMNAVGEVDDAIEDIRYTLRRMHNIDNPEGDLAKDDFQVMSQDQALGIMTSVTAVLTLFIVMIASISLVVGGVGIMNIMYVSVNQRTREIGLRKAVGATKNDILLQFLVEASAMTLIGGLIGVVFGVGTSYLLSLVIVKFQSQWKFLVNEQALVIALLVSIAIGIIFGLYPARKASQLDPIEALRYE